MALVDVLARPSDEKQILRQQVGSSLSINYAAGLPPKTIEQLKPGSPFHTLGVGLGILQNWVDQSHQNVPSYPGQKSHKDSIAGITEMGHLLHDMQTVARAVGDQGKKEASLQRILKFQERLLGGLVILPDPRTQAISINTSGDILGVTSNMRTIMHTLQGKLNAIQGYSHLPRSIRRNNALDSVYVDAVVTKQYMQLRQILFQHLPELLSGEFVQNILTAEEVVKTIAAQVDVFSFQIETFVQVPNNIHTRSMRAQCSPTLLRIISEDIVTNGINAFEELDEASKEGKKPSIWIFVEERSKEDGQFLCIVFEDNGRPFDPEILVHGFTQGKSLGVTGTEKPYGGTGFSMTDHNLRLQQRGGEIIPENGERGMSRVVIMIPQYV